MLRKFDFSGCAWYAHRMERIKAEEKCEMLLHLAAHAWALNLKAEEIIWAKYKALHDELYPRGRDEIIRAEGEAWSAELEPMLV